jgi:hypothetical protein
MTKHIHIIGPFNTGTNLLNNIISNSDVIDLVDNDSIVIYNNDNEPIHKHTLIIKDINNYLLDKNNIVIIMYKNVYNWLYSIKKCSYDIKFKNMYSEVELYSKKFANMIELYNFYYINYISILNNFNNVIFMDYEKIIDIDTDTSFDYINSKLQKINLQITSKDKMMIELSKPSKNHGDPVNSATDAKNNYKQNNKMVKQFVQEIPVLNKSVRSSIINYFEKI